MANNKSSDIFSGITQEHEDCSESQTIERTKIVRKSKKTVLWVSFACVSFVSLAALAAWPEHPESKLDPVNTSPDFNAPLPDPKSDYDLKYPVVTVLPPNDGSEYHQAGVMNQAAQETVSTADQDPSVLENTEATSERQTKVADLEKTIGELEQKVLKLTQQLEKKTAPSRKSKPQPVEVVYSSMKGTVSLNTIYRGQAWIQKEDQTFVVEEGDQFFGARIQKIDPDNRKVVTSLGVIR